MPEEDLDYWQEHPDLSDADILAVCRAWVSYQGEEHERPEWDPPPKPEEMVRQEPGYALYVRQGDPRNEPADQDPRYWAIEAVIDAESDAELHWRLIRCLCSLVEPDDEPVVGMIAASPLETQIFLEGERAMLRIEGAADEDPVLLQALTGVWWSDEPVGPRIDRYLEARGRSRPSSE